MSGVSGFGKRVFLRLCDGRNFAGSELAYQGAIGRNLIC